MISTDNLGKKLKSLVWNHRKFSEALALATSYASFSPPGSMILVVGASGAGKSTLLGQLHKGLAGPSDRWEQGTIPVAATTIFNEKQGLYNSKNFVLRLLQALEHPFYSESRINPVSDTDRGSSLAPEKIRLRYSEPHLRIALENAIAYRKTRFILIDEAQHLLKSGSLKKAIDSLDAIKGLAEVTGTIILLFGTFEVLELWNKSAQLNRRLQDLVLHRYYQNDEDLESFEQILESYSQKLPLAKRETLRDLNEFVYDVTYGIIGEVFRLIIGAYSRMVAESAVVITKEMIRAASHSPAKLLTLQRETLGGEAMLGNPEPTETSDRREPATKTKAGRRGRRNATRDPVKQGESLKLRMQEKKG